MAVVINGSGTVTGIAVGGLPDGIVDSGTLATNSVDSAELIDGSIDTSHIGTDQITSAIMPAGSILQVVQGSFGSNFATTATGQTASGYTVSLTPTTSGNKVLVFLRGNVRHGTNDSWGAVQIKDTTNGTFSDNVQAIARGTNEEHYIVFHQFTTTSTSSHTYELYQGSCDIGTKNYNRHSMILMEIAV